ncbi:MAG: hypothetical protein FJ387_20020 [Verrucomicrobia bacterium]|nr:hypothetical protein [Verrucomicrobiota bacterium]
MSSPLRARGSGACGAAFPRVPRRFARLGLAAFLATAGIWSTDARPFLSEFMANNQTQLADADGEYSDWIELANPDPAPLDLSGYYLTDDPDRPTRWRFPAVILGAGERLLVFASGKDRRLPGAPLHTNFRLDAAGEYLALVEPDGQTVVSEFAPQFPPQWADLSYGWPEPDSARDLLAGARVQVTVPAPGSVLAQDWFERGFVPDASWRTGAGLGLGYDTSQGVGAGVNLARLGTASQSSTGFGLGPGLAIDGDPSTFTHTGSDDNQSTWGLDLGREVAITRILLRNRTSCCQSRLRDLTVTILAPDQSTVRWRSSLLNPENTLGSPALLELDLFELNVGPVAGQFLAVERTPDPDLSGSGGQGNADEDNVLSLGEVEVYGLEAITFAPMIRTDLLAEMRGHQATALARIDFTLPEAAPAASLRLLLRYDDGFVAYLNGQQVAAANAPATLTADALATAERADAQALEFAVWELDSALLVAGENVLAFQGLNLAKDDDDFLLDPRLELSGSWVVQPAYFDTPTPGAPNRSTWFRGKLAPPQFSVARGFFAGPFELALASEAAGAPIVYTLDGSEPSESRGATYRTPLRLERTTVVRARVVQPEYRSSPVVTHTYLFLDSTLSQPTNPPGFPARWADVTADYEMDPAITQHPAYGGQLAAALASLPAVALTADLDDLFGASRGIYANPENRGVAWERPAACEWINPDGSTEFTVNCGVRIQGGWFRGRNNTQKHSLRLLFKDQYGPGRLRHDVFAEFGAARQFDTLVLRSGANDGYSWRDARDTEQFLRDEFGRRLMLALGHPSPRGRFVHLYLNGLYWGLYNLCERPNEDFSATYLGGVPADWDAVNSGEIKSGDLTAWNRLLAEVRTVANAGDFLRLQGLDANGVRSPAWPVWLDLNNYLDYMLLNIWGGNWDWPNKNFWFGRLRTPDSTGFKFYVWDFENTMGNNRGRSPLNMVAPRSGIESSWVAEPHARLKAFPEYQIHFADRVHRHCLGAGALTPAALTQQYRALADTVALAILAETARWGDDHHEPPQDHADWVRERDWLLDTYLVQRTEIVVAQFRTAGLYPLIEAPSIQPAGGSVSPANPPGLKTPARWLYYTLDGSDPRLPGGAPNPNARPVRFASEAPPAGAPPILVAPGAVWRYWDTGTDPGPDWAQAGYQDAAWLDGPAQLGYGDGDEATVVRYIDVDPAQSGIQRNAATYFRAAFVVSDPAAYESLTLQVTYDDAVAVYLNGRELYRTDNLPANANYQTYATASRPDNTVDSLTGLAPTLLQPGTNLIAAQVHQNSPGSSDLSFALSLTGILRAQADPTAHWNAAPPIALTGPAQVRARSWNGSQWSALTEAWFSLDTELSSSTTLVVAELAYRPPDAATPAEMAVSRDRDDYEFIELLNVGPKTLDLSGVRIVGGVQFQFGAQAFLSSGARLLVVGHRPAFEARYGNALPVAGEYTGRLANEGELLRLERADGSLIFEFTYSPRPPWPTELEDQGFTLVLRQPSSASDARDPAQWRPSAIPIGTPGGSDVVTLTGDPGADADNNGTPDLVDYALGAGEPGETGWGLTAELDWLPTANGSQPHLLLTLRRNLAAEQARVEIARADTATGPWSAAIDQLDYLGAVNLGDGLAQVRYRTRLPLETDRAAFFQLTVGMAAAGPTAGQHWPLRR